MHIANKKNQRQSALSQKNHDPSVMRELVGCEAPVDPRGNAAFTEAIYKCMEREFETKKRFCKLQLTQRLTISLADRDWMAKNT